MDTVTVTQAAAILGVSPRTVLWRIEHGQMHAERVSARLWLIPKESLELAARGKQRPGKKPKGRRDRDVRLKAD